MTRYGFCVAVEHLHDVLGVDGAARPGLALEAGDDALFAREELRDDDLERDATPGDEVHGLVDGSHAALAEHAHDPVLVVDDLRFHRSLRLGA
jgi:hypothetical protein